jgi:hypothetical protein
MANDISNNVLQNKEAWLRSLEKAGLYDALEQAKMTKAVDPQPVAAQSNSSEDLKSAGTSQIDLDQSPKSNVDDTYQARSSTSRNENLQGVYVRSKESVEFVNDRGGVITATTESGHTREEFESPMMAKYASLDIESLRYPLRNMMMMRSGSEVELWVRDASLSESKLVSTLKGLRQSMGMLGASLVKVVLNGQEVFSARQTERINAFTTKG